MIPQPKPHRVQLSRKKGWRMPDNTISVARPGFWGNPHAVHRGQIHWDGEAVDKNGEQVLSGPWLCTLFPDRSAGFWFPTKAAAIAKAVELYRWKMTTEGLWTNAQRRLSELTGKNLACWCPLDQPCHADVLLELANGGAA